MKHFRRSFPDPDSSTVDRLYDHGYYHGETSGYPSEGYACHHPDWTPWLDLISLFKPSGTLLDLGCAYGYLVLAAAQRGYRAWGADISSYALVQEADAKPRMARADLSRLPFATGAGDAVTLFDVLEHLHNPLAALQEAVRVLSPEGLLVGTTPDPLYLGRSEPTHFFERPPSFWIAALEDLGLTVRFRFSVEAYNFQFLAAFAGSETARRLDLFQHDFFQDLPDIMSIQGRVRLVPRAGWGPLRDGARRIAGRQATLYVLNLDLAPARLRTRFRLRHTPDFSTLRIRFDSQILAEVALTTEKIDHQLELPEVMVARGGHHFFFEVLPGGPEVEISSFVAESAPASRRDLTVGLPFDLFQRYQLAGEVASILEAKTVLDIGGVLGDQDGHMASSADFLGDTQGGRRVWTTDLRQADLPEHTPATAWRQPFEEGAFDLVVSLDVLEHLPPEKRPEFLAEIDRLAGHWAILAAPFADPEVEAAERSLSHGLLAARRFLQEHRELGLPRRDDIDRFFRLEKGRTVYTIPNGFLPRWTAMQTLTQLYFAFGDPELFRSFNQAYNERWQPLDQMSPAYRTFWIICKRPLADSQANRLEGLLSETRASPPLEAALFQEPAFLGLQDRVLDNLHRRETEQRALQFLLNERQKLIGFLQQEARQLRTELEETPLRVLAKRRLRKKYGK